MSDKFNVTWNTFSSHGQELFQDLMKSQKFSDVTLVSCDQYHFEAHKFILSACSSIFKSLLSSNPKNPFIYLRGVNRQEVESILQFMYLGEAKISHDRIDTFLNVAKDLNIKEIGSNVIKEEKNVETYQSDESHTDPLDVKDNTGETLANVENDCKKEASEESLTDNVQRKDDMKTLSAISNTWQCK